MAIHSSTLAWKIPWTEEPDTIFEGFPGGSEVKASASNVGNPGSFPVSGRSPGEGNGNPVHYSCLENPMDRGAWQATVHGITKVRRSLVTKPPPILHLYMYVYNYM